MEDGTLWCPDQGGCIPQCEEDCGCQPGTTDPATTSTQGNQEPTTTPEFENYCDKVCYGAEEGNNGECCQSLYCDCESYGNFDMDCPAELYWCPGQATCIANCEADCGCVP